MCTDNFGTIRGARGGGDAFASLQNLVILATRIGIQIPSVHSFDYTQALLVFNKHHISIAIIPSFNKHSLFQ